MHKNLLVLNKLGGVIQFFYRVFLHPHAEIKDSIHRQQARLLSAILLPYVFLMICIVWVYTQVSGLPTGPTPALVALCWVSLSIFLLCYTLSRTQYYNIAAFIFLAWINLSIYWAIFFHPVLEVAACGLPYLSVVVLLAALFFPLGYALGFFLINLVGASLVILALPHLPKEPLLQLLIFHAVSGTLLLISAFLRKGELVKLREERDHNLQFMREASALICQTSLEGKFIFGNSSFQNVTGYSNEELEGRSVWNVLYPTVEKPFSLSQTGRRRIDFRFPLTTKNGTERIVLWDCVERSNAELNGRQQVWSGQDITDSKILEKLQIKTHALEHALGGTAVVDLDNRVLEANREFARLVGLSSQELSGRDFISLFNKDSWPLLEDKLLELKQVGMARFELQEESSGEEIHLEVILILDCNGKIRPNPVFYCFTRDVTERVEKERLLTEARLAEQLKTSSKFSALGEMLASIGHEINNPLCIIHGYASRIKEMAHSDSGHAKSFLFIEMAEKIEATSMRISKIVSGLQVLSRDGQNSPDSTAPLNHVSVREVVDMACTLCGDKFKNHGIRLKKQGLESDCYVQAREVQLTQVLLNLLNNARDAVEKVENPEVVIHVNGANEEIEISVMDNGEGIPVAIRDKIFEPFFTTKPVGKGTGLGLSVSRSIIESHQGHFFLDESSHQTRFVVRLPRQAASG